MAKNNQSSHEDNVQLAYAATIAAARAAIRKELTEGTHKTSAVTAALSNDQGILWAEAFGSVDQIRGVAPTTDTLFCIASCSKVIAAVAVMILVDRRLVELDAPLVRQFAWVAPSCSRAWLWAKRACTRGRCVPH